MKALKGRPTELTKDQVKELRETQPELFRTRALDAEGRHTSKTVGKSLTRQADAAHTDINELVARYQETGMAPRSSLTPQFGDFRQVGDFMESLERVRAAQEDFQSLPSDVRDWADNDVATFLRQVSDPEAVPDLEELGLDTLRDLFHGPAEPAAAEPAPNPKTPPPSEPSEEPS